MSSLAPGGTSKPAFRCGTPLTLTSPANMSACAGSREPQAASATAISSLIRVRCIAGAGEALCAVFEIALFFVGLALLFVRHFVAAHFAERFFHRKLGLLKQRTATLRQRRPLFTER